MSMNSVNLIGRLTRDPELRYTQSGTAVANVTLAVDRNVTNKAGERETDFIDVVIWGKQAENVQKYMGKGRLVAISEGRIQTRRWEDKEGKTHKAVEVVAGMVQFLDRAKEGNGGGQVEESMLVDEDAPF